MTKRLGESAQRAEAFRVKRRLSLAAHHALLVAGRLTPELRALVVNSFLPSDRFERIAFGK